MPLIGRERERVRLLHGLRPGCVVLVTGPAGVGKSALAECVARESPPRAPVVYVPHARTCANAAAGIAAALCVACSATDRARLESRLLRAGGRVRSQVIETHRQHRERAIVFDHVDFPGPRLDGLVDRWRERTAVVLVARSEETLGKLDRHLYDCTRLQLEPLDRAAAAQLVEARSMEIGISLSGSEIETLARLTGGLPGLICRALRLRRESPGSGSCVLERLVRTARVESIGAERDAIIRGRRRKERRADGTSSDRRRID